MSTASRKSHLVLGYDGQVGSAVFEVLLGLNYRVLGLDLGTRQFCIKFDVIHCCLPYNPRFEKALRGYIKKYLKPDGLLIIHSTVPLGTSEKFSAVHSPIRGVHPYLAEGIRTFVKYFGGPRAMEAAYFFQGLGGTRCTPSARNTEALKLWDTTYYGWNILFEKFVHQHCKDNGLDFEIVYSDANRTYNAGYARSKPNVQRPVMKHKPGPIGGHCVMPNAKLLDSLVSDFLLQYGDTFQ